LKNSELKEKLESHYKNYRGKFSSKDPVWLLHRFEEKKEIELIGLLTAAYAYGSVDQINRFLENFLTAVDKKPYEFTINFQKRKDKKYLEGLNYRFNTPDDLTDLLVALSAALKEYGSLKNLFLSKYDPAHKNVLTALSGFVQYLNQHAVRKKGRYYHYLLSDPANGSTCKRMNLFMRWMVRHDEIDTGIWKEISTAKLIMPVDTHIARISQKLRLVNRKSIDMKFAVELTGALSKFDPVDPVKYDFALCHLGIDKKDF
jgi:uncharacterized protein (TIGR02757 family)